MFPKSNDFILGISINNIWKKQNKTEIDELGQTSEADQSDCFSFFFYRQVSQLVAAQGFQLCQSQSSKAKISFPLAKASIAIFFLLLMWKYHPAEIKLMPQRHHC